MANKSLFKDLEGNKSYMPTSEEDNYITVNGTVSSYAIKTGYTAPTKEITIEQWLKPDVSSKTMSSFSYAHSSSDNSVLLYNVNKNITPHVNNSTATTGLSLPSGVFSHLALTWRSSDGLLQVFINGIKRYETKNISKGFIIPSGGAVILGQEQDSVGGSFQATQAFLGGISETRVWNKVLTEEEIKQMMPVSLTGLEEGLVSCWSFSEGIGSKVSDKTLKAQDLTLIGASWKTEGVPLKGHFRWGTIDASPISKDMFDDYGIHSMGVFNRKPIAQKITVKKAEDKKFLSTLNFSEINNVLAIKIEVK
ncbi:LamG-like jellyroll fold domain-containing protein [Lysinibacillus fusiformis]|uniref:LamG-like jellyroll fold domain-containing protein n=1 Tax=Lysinibacillus fusiformis TaxID=28031 RepID=UPI001882DAA6|nr:LamG-like jellyroll fold domain-containing protein [Lysinibacillus fusiformis]MBD8523954.1 hypothetical protein [Lysinibacillus fusiformis]